MSSCRLVLILFSFYINAGTTDVIYSFFSQMMMFASVELSIL